MAQSSVFKAVIAGLMITAGSSQSLASEPSDHPESKKSPDSPVRILWKGKEFPGQIHAASQGADGVSFPSFFAETKLKMFDPGLQNTAICQSRISCIDGQKGQLSYRGYPIEALAEATYLDVVYLLIFGELPDQSQLNHFSNLISKYDRLGQNRIPSGIRLSDNLSPILQLSEGLTRLGGYFPEFSKSELNAEEQDEAIAMILSQISHITANIYRSKKPHGQLKVAMQNIASYLSSFSFLSSVSYLTQTPEVEPSSQDYISRFIGQTWGKNSQESQSKSLHKALNLLLILHAEHGQNCSTTTVQTVASAKANIFASLNSGVHALSGDAHGKASEDVVNLLETLRENALKKARQTDTDPESQIDSTIEEYLEKVLRKEVRLPGFGHRVYKKTDPRAKIIKSAALEFVRESRESLELKIALRLESLAQENQYFTDRNLYPNVDFYSGLVYKTAGFPKDMMTVMFALSRTSGWLAHWKEMQQDGFRITRPGQIYLGKTFR